MANDLNQAFLNSNLDITGESEVLLSDTQIGHLRHELLLALFVHSDVHLLSLLGLLFLFLLGVSELGRF